MPYSYNFDDTPAGNLNLSRERYRLLTEAYRSLLTGVDQWNERAIANGAPARPYQREARDLRRMVEWSEKRLRQPGSDEFVEREVSVGSLRYAKAALQLAIMQREAERDTKHREGWPEGVIRSIDLGIEKLRGIERLCCIIPR